MEKKSRLIANHACPDVCAVINLATMTRRKAKLRHSKKLPLTIYKGKDDQIRYMAHQKVTDIIRKAVKAVYPDTPKGTLLRYSCHSIRVWAFVCLDAVGQQPDTHQEETEVGRRILQSVLLYNFIVHCYNP